MEGPGYLVVTIKPGADTDETALDEWYAQEHGPLRLRLPFITTGARYKAVDGQQPSWSAVYDISDLACLEKRVYTRLREERSNRETKVMSTFSELDRRIYSLIETTSRPGATFPAPVQLTEISSTVAADSEHRYHVSELPSWLRTRKFKLVVNGKGMPEHDENEYLVLHDLSSTNGSDRVTTQTSRLWTHYHSFDALEEPPSSILTTDGAELRFQLEGNPVDPVIVFVNSILTNFHIWDDVAAALMQGVNGQTYRVLRYNSRGYQQQWSGSRDTTFDILADDLEYLLFRLRIDKAHAIVGVSMGGVTAINFAIRYPTMLHKYVACDCNVAAGTANNKAWAERMELARTQGMPVLARVTAERWFTMSNHESRNFSKVVNMIESANLDGFVQSAAALCNYDLKPKLSTITVPGLLLAGDSDGKLPEVMQTFGIPGASFQSIANAGHLPMLEDNEVFVRALAGFL